ncbi:MAG: AAA family ATPase [Muribaculaceae bacterium]|nr:AAA family ATPase [Muribaculaceae bacterium]
MNTLKCAKCGNALKADDRFCSQCGTECRIVDIDFSIPGNNEEVSRCMAMLDSMEGLNSVKEEIHEIVKFVKMDSVRTQMMGYPSRFPRKYLFIGNPCTGRTTVARLMADILHALGVMPEHKMIAVWSKALVGGTAEKCRSKVRNAVESALGGVLFIDDIHLLNDNNDELAQATTSELISIMQEHQDDLLCIVAGTPAEIEVLCKSHPNFRSQFDRVLVFER